MKSLSSLSMAASAALLSLLSTPAHGLRILQSNDDGWAEHKLRALNDAYIAAGHDVILSAPAEDKSATGQTDMPPMPRRVPCHWNSCLSNSGPAGFNATRPELNWVNSFPITATRHGLEVLAPQRWGGRGPELVVTGPNNGANLWLALPSSGTACAAAYAAQLGIPAIALSGKEGASAPWNASPPPAYSAIYAALALNLTHALARNGGPLLPEGVFLNVNFARLDGDRCNETSKFHWFFTRINPPTFSPRDTWWCNHNRLPMEFYVMKRDDCPVSVTVTDPWGMSTINDNRQEVVLSKLRHMLTCP